MKRTLYVDGFNFYHQVTAYWSREKGLAGLGWCDFRALVERHFPDPGHLRNKYFTAPITEDVELRDKRPGEHGRYSIWMRALRTISELEVVERFYKRTGHSARPGGPAHGRKEKQTDVNVAVEMVVDACGPANSRPDHVFLLSGDYDEMPVVFALQQRVSTPIGVTVLLPSSQNEGEWKQSYERTRKRLLNNRRADAGDRSSVPGEPVQVKVLDEAMLANSLLRYVLRDPAGGFSCPPYWKLPPGYLKQWCRNASWLPERNIL
jgi:hypothetical protein